MAGRVFWACWSLTFPGRHSIWICCSALFVAGAAFGYVAVPFSWQAQHLVMLECHFSWQAQHLDMLQCPFRGRRSIWWCWSVIFRGRRSIWICCSALFVGGAAFGDVGVSFFVAGAAFGYVAVPFSWQAQHLVMLECHFSWQAQHLDMLQCPFRGRRSIWWCWSVIFRGRRSIWICCSAFFVAGAAFGEIWVDSRSAKRCNFQYKMRLRSAKITSANGRVRVDESAAHCKWRINCFRQISLRFWSASLRGRRNLWWHWRLSAFALKFRMLARSIMRAVFVAGAIFGNVGGWVLVPAHCTWRFLYVRTTNHGSHFLWQAQYLVTLEDDFCCPEKCN